MVESKNYETMSPEEQGHVMDSLNKTLDAMSLIGFDATAWAKKIQDSAVTSANDWGRGKTVFATVRGSGGGKTRAFTEIRRGMLTNDNMLVLLITFNNKWDASTVADNWPGVKSPDISYALSVVLRMAAMYFNQNLEVIRDLMTQCFLFSTVQGPILKSGKRILVQFIVWMIYRIRQYRPSVDTFILLADEVVKMEYIISKKFSDIEDITSVLRGALLDELIMVRPPNSTVQSVEDSVLKVALALSSLETSPIGESLSARPVEPIILPAELDYKEVVSKIWAPSINTKRVANQEQKVSREELFRLELVAVTMNNIPRLVQFANEYFLNNECSDVNSTLVHNLLGDLNSRIADNRPFPTSSVLRSIIFNTEIALSDPGLKKAIAYIMITNSVTVFDEKLSLSSLQTSIFMLNKAVSNTKSEIAKSVHEGLTNILESLKNVSEGNLGRILEVLVYNWLKIRLDVAAATFAESVSLETIF
eukprot:gene36363-biopygen3449